MTPEERKDKAAKLALDCQSLYYHWNSARLRAAKLANDLETRIAEAEESLGVPPGHGFDFWSGEIKPTKEINPHPPEYRKEAK